MQAPHPPDEARRLRVLKDYRILDTGEEHAFDQITRLAARLSGTPMASISLVDETRQWFKAKIGLAFDETPRDWAFCAHALDAVDPLVVPDARMDKRFANNPLVLGEPGIRFYAGAPLRAPTGEVLGTLCVIDRVPRQISPDAIDDLALLAGEVMIHLELRRQLALLTASEARYRSLFEQNPHPMWVYDLETLRFLAANDAAVAHYGYSREEFLSMDLTDIRPDEDVPALLENVARVDEGLDRAGLWRHRTRDGRLLIVDITSHTLDFDGHRAEMVLALDVTERIQAEKTRKWQEQSRATHEARIRQLADSLPLIVWTATPEGLVDYSNQHFFTYTGVGRDEEPGHRWQKCLHPDDLEACLLAWKTSLRDETPFGIEYRIRRQDGQYRWFHVQANPIRDAEGRIALWYGTAIDIHPTKELEATATRLAARLTTSLESITDAFVTLDSEGRFTYVNAEAERLLGHGQATLLGQNFRQVFPQIEATSIPRHFQDAVASGTAVTFEEFDPIQEKWYEIHAYPSTEGLGVYCRDVTESHLYAEQVAEQAALLDKAQDAILVRGLDHSILYWNRSAERLYGWTPGEAKGRSILELLYKEPEAFRQAQDTVLRKGEWVGEIEQVTQAGKTIVVEGRWTLVRDAQGRPKSVLAINTDISQRKSLEAQFLRAQRMESIGTLAGGIAHDLNNVFNPIMMATELLQMRVEEPNCREILQTIVSSAKRGAEMVSQVLSFARGMDGRRLEVQVKHLLRDIDKIMRDTFPKNIQTTLRMDGNLWAVEGDPTQLHQVLLNLCVNARDALPGGGDITLHAENVTLDEQYAAMNIEARVGPHVRIEVEDNGTGIPKEIIDKIFDPFFTTKDIGKGTGLGLSTSLAIVKSHGGFLRAYSDPGVGSKLRVYLPAKTTASGEVLPVEEPALPRGQGETILVVDDEAAIRQITRQTLEAFGYRVKLAADGAEAVSLYVEHRQEIAVVLTDMMMPVMDGPATIKVLRRFNPEVRIIGASGITGNGKIARAADAGVEIFLPKPYTAETLLKAIHRILHGG